VQQYFKVWWVKIYEVLAQVRQQSFLRDDVLDKTHKVKCGKTDHMTRYVNISCALKSE